MLYVSNLSKRYGDNLLFDNAHFVINEGQRVGLVGPNGCGKTTLMRILVGEEAPTEGNVRCEVPSGRVGYLPQALSCFFSMNPSTIWTFPPGKSSRRLWPPTTAPCWPSPTTATLSSASPRPYGISKISA
ncbi:MAG: ATP-binding cassette domain-containing protein [Chloroflexota bacterium]|nr:ATP-binding cassette domain-containing protein [Chloroflexota bacterium]